jgi:CubicO group peptidase (beta-lactamase class C family)
VTQTDESDAPSPPVPLMLERVAAAIATRAERGEFSGTVLLARQGKALICRGYGLAHIEQGTPNTPQTKFQLASITKQFTALAILMLQEQGKLDVQDRLSDLVPTGVSAWREVTIHHLLTHTSGIPDLSFWPNFIDPTQPGPITPAYLRELFGAKPLHGPPGTRFVYSNWGYILLGYVIEQISGLPYATFLQRHVFTPAGMTSSGYADRRAVLHKRAASYAIEHGTLTNASFLDLEDAYAAGGLYSTVEDLLCWDRTLMDGTVLSHTSLAAMLTPHVPIGDGSSYGYGWQIGRRFGRQVVYHGGRIDGFRVLLARYPAEQVCIAVLANLQTCDPEALADTLAAALFEYGCIDLIQPCD